MKENILYALMVLSIVGFDWKLVNIISSKYNVPKQTMVEKANANSYEMQQIKQIIENQSRDEKFYNFINSAKQDAKEIKQQVKKDIPQQQKIIVTDDLINVVKSLEGSKIKDVSYKGAVGTMQIMPQTWNYINKKYYAKKYPFEQYRFNNEINQMFGKKYLEELAQWIEIHKNEWKANPYFLLLVAYNAGPGNVLKCNFDEKSILEKLPSAHDYATRGINLLS